MEEEDIYLSGGRRDRNSGVSSLSRRLKSETAVRTTRASKKLTLSSRLFSFLYEYRWAIPALEEIYDDMYPPVIMQDTLLNNDNTTAWKIKAGFLSEDGRMLLNQHDTPDGTVWDATGGEFLFSFKLVRVPLAGRDG